MKIFAIGDMHGTYKALLQCLQRSQFDYENDLLVVLGDICDGYPEVRECIDELLKIKHCDLAIGNHDLWALDWALKAKRPEIWTTQGGANTIRSYEGGPMPDEHIQFLKSGKLWIEIGKQVFVHGGFHPSKTLAEHSAEELVWDRELLDLAVRKSEREFDFQFGGFSDVFIGHTPTQRYGSLEPIHACNVWALDTGAGWSGKLTIMNAQSKEFWQSDLTPELYHGIQGRTK